MVTGSSAHALQPFTVDLGVPSFPLMGFGIMDYLKMHCDRHYLLQHYRLRSLPWRKREQGGHPTYACGCCLEYMELSHLCLVASTCVCRLGDHVTDLRPAVGWCGDQQSLLPSSLRHSSTQGKRARNKTGSKQR